MSRPLIQDLSVSVLFPRYSMQITYPITYFPSNWNILTFFTTFRFDSFHFILFCASWALSCEFTLSKGKKLRGNVVFTTTAICIYFASLTLICKLLFIRRISLETKISILNSQMLAFWGTPFILAIKILKAKLQTFHSNVLMRESYEKCCNWLKSRNTL